MQIDNSLAILIPLYKSEGNIESALDYVDELSQLLKVNLFIRFIIDGRVEDYNDLIIKVKSKKVNWNYDIMILAKNFGVGPALIAGLQDIKTEFVTSFGADLQEPKSLFLEMLHVMRNGEADLCLGVRNSRRDPLIHNLGARIFWKINRYILGKEVPSGGFDVFMINQSVKESMLTLKELNTNFTSQMFWIGFKRKFIYFDRIERKIGKSSWTFRKKLKLFFDSIYGFSDLPIKVILYLSYILIFSSALFLLLNLYFKLNGFVQIPGYYTVASLITLGNGINFFFLSIIGSYVYRTFQNSTERPPFIIKGLITKDDVEEKRLI